MTVSRIGLELSALLLPAVLLGAPAALAKGGEHGHRVTIHFHKESSSGNSKHEPGGVPVHQKAPARMGPPPYSWDDDGRLVSHGEDDEGGGRGGDGAERGDK